MAIISGQITKMWMILVERLPDSRFIKKGEMLGACKINANKKAPFEAWRRVYIYLSVFYRTTMNQVRHDYLFYKKSSRYGLKASTSIPASMHTTPCTTCGGT